MLSPLGPSAWGSYSELRKRVLRRLRSDSLSDELFGAAQRAYEQALAVDDLVLSRVEKKRLMQDVLKVVLDEVKEQLES